MKIIYIRETEETCDIIKRMIVKIKKIFNIVNIENKNPNIIYYLPIFRVEKISKHSVKRLSVRIIKFLEKEGSNTIVLSKYLENNQLLKNYLYTENINILDGRYLLKCLSCEMIEYIFKIKNKEMKFRRSFITN